MNHSELKRHLAEYLEGDLALDERAMVDAHLDACPDCAQDVDQMRQTIRLLQMLPDPEPSPTLAADVMRRIRAGEAEPSWLARIGRMIGSVLEPTFVLPASAVAVAALVVMVIQQPGTHSPLVVNDSGGGLPLPENMVLHSARTQLEADLAGLELDMSRAFRGASSPSNGFPGTPPASLSAAAPSAAAPAAARFEIRIDREGARVARISPGARPTRVAGSHSEGAGARSAELEAKAGQGIARAPSALVASRDVPWRVQDRALARDGEETWNGDAGRAQRVAQSVRGEALAPFPKSPQSPQSPQSPESSGGEDPRDEWLSRGLEDPLGFTRFIGDKNLAEQELWVARLAERAQVRGVLDELVSALRRSGDVSAAILGDDFAAQADALTEDASGWEAPFQR